MRSRCVLCLISAVVLLMLGAPSSIAAEDGLFGKGLENLEFDGPGDDYGLKWVVHEPNRLGEPWIIAVKNVSNHTYSDLVVTLEIKLDGTWYLGGMQASENLVRPYTLSPGEIGFVDAGSMGGGQDWDDSRAVLVSIDEGPSDIGVSLPVSDVRMGSDGFTGDVTNTSGQDVTHLFTEFYCANDDGRIYLYAYATSDLRIFADGEVEPFKSARVLGQCDDPSEAIVSATARIDQ